MSDIVDLKKSETKKEMYPTEAVSLPSAGWFYSIENPLSSGVLNLRLPTAKAEDILTSRNLITKGIVIDELLKSLITDDINYEDILLGDKNGLIIAARMLLYGSNYTTVVKCPNCGASNTKTYNLSDLESKELDFEKLGPKGTNSFDFELPISKTKIKFKFLTQRDESDVETHLKKMKKNFGGDSEITTRLSYVITQYGNESGQSKILKLIIDTMTSRDSKAFRDYLAEVTPGIETDILFECDECSYSDDITLPMDINFFWPSRRLQK